MMLPPSHRLPLDPTGWSSKSLRSLRRFWGRYWIGLFIPLVWILTNHFGVAINLSESLPQKVWLVHLHQTPKRGDYVVFRVPAHTGLQQNHSLIKQVRGVPGDLVENFYGYFFINDDYVSKAKPYSLTGTPLISGFEGRLMEGEYYVHSPHPDSFDSRYQAMGLIHADAIMGVAYALW